MTTQPIAIEDRGDFKFWAADHPNLHKLLGEVIFRWRNTSARIPGKPGKWCVFPIPDWCKWTALSSDQVERGLKALELQGLIVRHRRKFQGVFRAFIQPTPLALRYAGRPADMSGLGLGKAASCGNGPSIAAGMQHATSAGIGAGTSITPFPPSSLEHPTSLPIPPAGDGTGVTGKYIDHEDDEDLESIQQQQQANKDKACAELLKQYPRIAGPHSTAVKHPLDYYGIDWRLWSPEVKAKSHAKYLGMVTNWCKKHGLPVPDFSPPKAAEPISEPMPQIIAAPKPKEAAAPTGAQLKAMWAAEEKASLPTMAELQAILNDTWTPPAKAPANIKITKKTAA